MSAVPVIGAFDNFLILLNIPIEKYRLHIAGGPSEHNFWTSRVNPIKNYIRIPGIEIYRLVYRSGVGGGWSLQNFSEPLSRSYEVLNISMDS